MASGYGMAGHIGLAKESSGANAIAATDFVEALSESVSRTIERFDTKNIIGRLSEPDDQAGLNRYSGDITIPGHPESVGHLIDAVTGIRSTSTVGSNLFTHEFTMRTSDFDRYYAQDPLTLEIFRDVNSAQQVAGVNVTMVEMSFSPNQDVRFTASVIGTTETGIAPSNPTYPNTPVDEFAFDTASISLDGVATDEIEGLTVSIDNQLEGYPALNNSEEIARIRRTGPQLIRVSGNIVFEDEDHYNDFVSQNEKQMKVSVTKPDSFQMVLDLPRVVYETFELGMGGRERQVVSFEGRAFYHQGSANAVKIDLTNTKSTY